MFREVREFIFVLGRLAMNSISPSEFESTFGAVQRGMSFNLFDAVRNVEHERRGFQLSQAVLELESIQREVSDAVSDLAELTKNLIFGARVATAVGVLVGFIA